MKTTITLLFLCLSFIVFGQNSAAKLTIAHQHVAGTKVSLIPPKDFTKAVNFIGFQQTKSGSSLMVLNIPGSFTTIVAGFTKEGLLTQGVDASKIENMKVGSLPAVFITAEQKAYGNTYTKYILAFGSEKETILLNGIFPKDQPALKDPMKKALLSVVYEATKKTNPFDSIDYKIDTTGTGLVFANSVSNSMIFNRDGIIPSKSKDQAAIIITKSFSSVMISDKKTFAINRIKQLPIEIEKIISTTPITVDSISGYEVIADAKDKKSGVKEKAYQVLLFKDAIYYMFFASCEANFDMNIELFRKIVNTFELKN